MRQTLAIELESKENVKFWLPFCRTGMMTVPAAPACYYSCDRPRPSRAANWGNKRNNLCPSLSSEEKRIYGVRKSALKNIQTVRKSETC